MKNTGEHLNRYADVTPGQYIDYALSDYFQGPVSSNYYTGMTNSKKVSWYQEFNLGRFLSFSGGGHIYQQIVDDGYGAHLIFALDQSRSDFRTRQLPELQTMTKALFNDEVVYDGLYYPADHK